VNAPTVREQWTALLVEVRMAGMRSYAQSLQALFKYDNDTQLTEAMSYVRRHLQRHERKHAEEN
jgi:hypothetical protein